MNMKQGVATVLMLFFITIILLFSYDAVAEPGYRDVELTDECYVWWEEMTDEGVETGEDEVAAWTQTCLAHCELTFTDEYGWTAKGTCPTAYCSSREPYVRGDQAIYNHFVRDGCGDIKAYCASDNDDYAQVTESGICNLIK